MYGLLRVPCAHVESASFDVLLRDRGDVSYCLDCPFSVQLRPTAQHTAVCVEMCRCIVCKTCPPWFVRIVVANLWTKPFDRNETLVKLGIVQIVGFVEVLVKFQIGYDLFQCVLWLIRVGQIRVRVVLFKVNVHRLSFGKVQLQNKVLWLHHPGLPPRLATREQGDFAQGGRTVYNRVRVVSMIVLTTDIHPHDVWDGLSHGVSTF